MPFGVYPAKDGAVALACPGPKHWERLCRQMGRAELIEDPRCKNTFVRKRNQAFVEEQISAWTASLSKQEVMAQLGGKVPCGPVNTAEEIFNDPHVAARQMVTRFKPQGKNPEVAIVGTPLKFTATPAGFYRRPPNLGEHQQEILDELQNGLQAKPEARKRRAAK